MKRAGRPAPADLRRAAYVADHYRDIQGLRTAAWGAPVLAASLVLALVPSPALWASTIWMAVALVQPALAWVVRRYYRRIPAEIKAAAAERGFLDPASGWGTILLLGIVWLVLVVGVGVPMYVLSAATLLLASLGFAGYVARRDGLRLRPHWVVACVALAAMSLALLLSLPHVGPLHPYTNRQVANGLLYPFSIPLGLALIVCGVLDHRLLVRTFPGQGQT